MLVITVVPRQIQLTQKMCKVLHISYYLFAYYFPAKFGRADPISRQAHAIRASTAMLAGDHPEALLIFDLVPRNMFSGAFGSGPYPQDFPTAFGEVWIGDPFLAGPSLESFCILMQCGRRASARLRVIFRTHRLASAPDDVLSCQAPGSVARIHYQLRFRHYGSVVILRMICRDDDTIELWNMVQRGTCHIERILAATPC